MMTGCTGNSQQFASDTTYPVGLMFSSECCGVPSEATLQAFTNSFKHDHSILQINAIHIGPIGREGEYRIAFPLAEMNKSQKGLFISGLKSIEKPKDDPGNIHVITDFRVNMKELPKRAKQTEIHY